MEQAQGGGAYGASAVEQGLARNKGYGASAVEQGLAGTSAKEHGLARSKGYGASARGRSLWSKRSGARASREQAQRSKAYGAKPSRTWPTGKGTAAHGQRYPAKNRQATAGEDQHQRPGEGTPKICHNLPPLRSGMSPFPQTGKQITKRPSSGQPQKNGQRARKVSGLKNHKVTKVRG